MRKRKPSQTRRHRESVRAKRKARAFYFERQAAKDNVKFKDSRWKTIVGICVSILVGLAAAWLSYIIVH